MGVTVTPEDLGAGDVVLARRVIAHARTIVPCLDSLTGDARQAAVAVLTGVLAEAVARGARGVVSQRVGTASVTYTAASAASWFTPDDRAALRALCRTGLAAAGHPVGRFPPPSTALGRAWPDEPEEA